MDSLFQLVILGIIAYLVDRFIPMQEAFKTVFRIICIIVAIIILLGFLGVAVPRF